MNISDRSSFITEFRKRLAESAQRWTKVLRKHDVITPKFPGDVLRFSRVRSWKEYLRLVLVHWYLPEDLRFLIHLELEEKIHMFGPDKEIVALTILKSEPNCVIYISESSNVFKTTREAFGFILSDTDWSKYRLYQITPRRSKTPQRKRGYNDHGFRRPDHKWRETHDKSFTELQNEIEDGRKVIIDTSKIIEGGLP